MIIIQRLRERDGGKLSRAAVCEEKGGCDPRILGGCAIVSCAFRHHLRVPV